jgi:hypothetical protein
MTLADFVLTHSKRGACGCGRCADAPPVRIRTHPGAHVAHMVFFEVSEQTPGTTDVEQFKQLIQEHRGHYGEVNVFDGREHNYLELGGWLGDQGLALQFMGLGALLGMWKLLTPMTVLGFDADTPLAKELAGYGFIVIQAPK